MPGRPASRRSETLDIQEVSGVIKSTASRDASEELARLLSRCSLGDQGAFADLYEATSAKLFGVALRLLRRAACAEEALQEAFVTLWRHADSYTPARGRPITSLINSVRPPALALPRPAESSAHAEG